MRPGTALADGERNPGGADWPLFARQLGNIKSEPTKASYASYKMVDPKIGDDLSDAAMAAVWALVTRGAIGVPKVIASRTQTREWPGAIRGPLPGTLPDTLSKVMTQRAGINRGCHPCAHSPIDRPGDGCRECRHRDR